MTSRQSSSRPTSSRPVSSRPTASRVAAVTLSAALIVAACGGDDDDAAQDAPVAGTAAATPATDPPPPDPTEPPPTATEAPDTDATAEPAGTVVPVSLIEWAIDAPTEIAGGTVTFEATNDGEFRHELAIARGDSYETLPLLDNGAVDETALGADFLGRTDIVEAGESSTLTVELEPGNYVLLCNIAVGPNSHAAQGQVLSIVVTG